MRSAPFPCTGCPEAKHVLDRLGSERLSLGEGADAGVDGGKEGARASSLRSMKPRSVRRGPRSSPSARAVSAAAASTCRRFHRKRRSMISCITRQKSVAAS